MPFDQVNFVLPAVETDSVLRCLTKARELITDPTRWCRRSRAMTEHGAYTEPQSGAAFKFCTVGSLQRAVGEKESWRAYSLPAVEWLNKAAVELFPDCDSTVLEPCVIVNDRRSHADVLAVFDRAIAARRKELDHA